MQSPPGGTATAIIAYENRHEDEPMARKCYISFKAEDIYYKESLQDLESLDVIDKSLNEPINSTDEDYILQVIRSDYLSNSTITLHLIGAYGAEIRGWYEQRYIKRELQGSLYDSQNNRKNGILGIVLPGMIDTIYAGEYDCASCGGTHRHVAINDYTTISEFSYNYYIPNGRCAHTEDERYCVLVGWSDFLDDPNTFIEKAFAKRTAPIADKTKVRPQSSY